MTAQACPECRAGKHRNCDGTSWDQAADAPVPCPCSCSDGLLGVAYPEEETSGG
jgi:hypothetical protein